MGTQGSPVQRAILYFQRSYKEAASETDLRLPTIQQIAREVGVSTATVCKAVTMLKRQGMLEVSQKRGIRMRRPTALSTAMPVNAPSGRIPRHDQITKAIAGKVADSTWEPDSLLPSIKELAVRYGSCYTVVKKSLELLCSDGLLERFRRGYRVRVLQPRIPQVELLVIVIDDDMENLGRMTPRSSEFWRILEREGRRMNFTITVRPVEWLLRSGKVSPRTETNTLIGCLVLSLGMNQEQYDHVISILVQESLPCVVMDEGVEFKIPWRALNNRKFHFIPVAVGTGCGKDCGNYLLSSGHRHIACFSTDAEAAWSSNRIKGVLESYCAAGLGDCVRVFEIGNISEYGSYVGMKRGSDEYRLLLDSYRNLQKTMNSDLDDTPAFMAYIASFLLNTYLIMRLQPMFEAALSDPDITAWLLVSDVSALGALNFLVSKGITPGKQLSVIGFDDTASAFLRGLTSYNFNMQGVVQHILDIVFRTRYTIIKRDHRVIEVPGMIMERQSTAIAKS